MRGGVFSSKKYHFRWKKNEVKFQDVMSNQNYFKFLFQI